MRRMLGLQELPLIDEQRLPADVVAVLRRMRQHIEQQAGEIERKDCEIERRDREIVWRDTGTFIFSRRSMMTVFKFARAGTRLSTISSGCSPCSASHRSAA